MKCPECDDDITYQDIQDGNIVLPTPTTETDFVTHLNCPPQAAYIDRDMAPRE